MVNGDHAITARYEGFHGKKQRFLNIGDRPWPADPSDWGEAQWWRRSMTWSRRTAAMGMFDTSRENDLPPT